MRDTRNIHIKDIIVRNGLSYVRTNSSGSVSAFQFLTRTMRIVSEAQLPVFLLTSSSTNVSLTVELDKKVRQQLENKLSPLADITIEEPVTHICIIETDNPVQPFMENDLLGALQDIPIRMISYDSDNHSLSLTISEKDTEHVLQLLCPYCQK